MKFKGKVVIVTGSGKSIGRCIASTYASEGANVVIDELYSGPGQETERLTLRS